MLEETGKLSNTMEMGVNSELISATNELTPKDLSETLHKLEVLLSSLEEPQLIEILSILENPELIH